MKKGKLLLVTAISLVACKEEVKDAAYYFERPEETKIELAACNKKIGKAEDIMSLSSDAHCSEVFIAYRGIQYNNLKRAQVSGNKLWESHLRLRNHSRAELRALRKDLGK